MLRGCCFCHGGQFGLGHFFELRVFDDGEEEVGCEAVMRFSSVMSLHPVDIHMILVYGVLSYSPP